MPKWEGRFSSLKLPQGIACGTIVVDRVEPQNEGYTTNATITYTGLFRKGTVINVSVVAQGNEMSIDLKGRHVTFRIDNRKEKLVSGSYIVDRGVDHGQFVLQPEGSPPLEDPRQCNIM